MTPSSPCWAMGVTMDRAEQKGRASIPALAAAFFAGIIVALGWSSRAEGSIGVGACRYTGLTEGVWYQDQFDGFKGNLSTACAEAEWRSEGKSGLAVGLAHLGYLHGNNIATINDTTDAYKTYTGGACEPGGKNCLARFMIDTATYGITLGAFTKVGRFSLEGGLLFYRSEFNVTTQRIHDGYGYPELSEYRIVSYNNSPYVGVSYGADDFYARLRVYQEINQDGETYPYKGLTSGPAAALTVGVRF